MESRSRKILMMINDDKNSRQTKAIDEPQMDNYSENTLAEANKYLKTVTTSDVNSLMDSCSRTMVETWIDNNDFENQDPTSSLLEEAHSTSEFQNQYPKLTESNNTERVHTPTMNETSGNAKNSDSSNNGDFSPSEGSEYKPPSRAKQPINKAISSNRSSSSSSSTSSSSSSSSSSGSSSSSSVSSSSKSVQNNNMTVLGNNETDVGPERTLNMNEDNVEQESNKRQSRKRQKNTHLWKQNITKRLKNTGQEYTTKRGKTVQAKSIRPPCKDSCRLSCSTNISTETRNSIFKTYWDLGTFLRQRDFLASCVKRIEPEFRRIRVKARNTFNKPPRKPNASYYFMINGNEVRVCIICLFL